MKSLDDMTKAIRLNMLEELSLINLVNRKARIRVWLLGLIFLLVGSVVHAEDGCAPGMIPEGAQGVSSCRPIPNHVQSQGHWVDEWGAIATDPLRHSAGVVVNEPSEKEAAQTAIANCQSNDGLQCKVEMTYVNECAAVIVGATGHNVGRADTIDHAVQLGKKV